MQVMRRGILSSLFFLCLFRGSSASGCMRSRGVPVVFNSRLRAIGGRSLVACSENSPLTHWPKRVKAAGNAQISRASSDDAVEGSQIDITPDIRAKLAMFGFVDEEENLAAMKKASGDVKIAIKLLSSEAASDWEDERRNVEELMEKGG